MYNVDFEAVISFLDSVKHFPTKSCTLLVYQMYQGERDLHVWNVDANHIELYLYTVHICIESANIVYTIQI